MPGFSEELQKLINQHSKEGDSNTPDFILAQYIEACLAAYSTATNKRDQWYGVCHNIEAAYRSVGRRSEAGRMAALGSFECRCALATARNGICTKCGGRVSG